MGIRIFFAFLFPCLWLSLLALRAYWWYLDLAFPICHALVVLSRSSLLSNSFGVPICLATAQAKPLCSMMRRPRCFPCPAGRCRVFGSRGPFLPTGHFLPPFCPFHCPLWLPGCFPCYPFLLYLVCFYIDIVDLDYLPCLSCPSLCPCIFARRS